MNIKCITLQDVRASLNPEVKGYFVVRWFGRPAANWITPAFYNRGWSANGVTALRALMALFGLLCLTFPSYAGALAASLMFYLCFVLDCIDGNLARLRDTASYWGKFIDGLTNSVFVMLMSLAAGIGLAWQGESVCWLLAGSLTTTVALASQMTRNRLSFMRELMVNQSGPIGDDALRSLVGVRRVQRFVAEIYVNGIRFVPLALLVPGGGRFVFVALLIPFQLIVELLGIALSVAEGSKLLNRSRRSIHAAVKPTDKSP